MSKNKEKTAAEEVKEEQTAPAGENTEETKAEETAEVPKAAETQAEEKPAEEKKPEKDPAAELAAMNDKYLRLMAEYDNYRKRSQKEKDALYGDIKANTLKTFLPVYDNLVRALAQQTEDEEKGENEIVEVFQQGFMLGDKVIRFAMVKVAN